MNRIERKFRALKKEGKKAFIAYITSGDPDLKTTERLVPELQSRGADIVELGVPFSDPIADGPTIQAASERALKNGVSVKKILALVRRIRCSCGVPLVLMTYYNPVYAYGIERFVSDALGAGVDGLIVPDLPPEEAGGLIASSKKKGLDVIFLLSPTSAPGRMRLVSRASRGFIYYVSLTGVTGARKQLPSEIARNVRAIKKHTAKPVCVGFGVSGPSPAKSMAQASDGVIVGSAIIRVIEKNLGRKDLVKRVGRFVGTLVRAVKKA